MNIQQVSVAMAVCNGAQYIPCQVDSILSQLSPGDELVISYDASNDGTWDVISAYKAQDPRVKIFRNDRLGVAANFSNAISHCEGDVIFISDQDDQWMQNKRSRVLQAFMETGADMVIHNGIHTDAQLNPVSEPFFSTSRIGNGKIRNIMRSRYSGCCMAFTREMRKAILPIPTDIDAYDRWSAIVAEFTGNIAYVDDILILHRIHGMNVTPTDLRSIVTIIKTRINLLNHLFRRLKRERRARCFRRDHAQN